MTRGRVIEIILALIFIWVMGVTAGYNIGIKAQSDISIPETDHSVETDHHAHQ